MVCSVAACPPRILTLQLCWVILMTVLGSIAMPTVSFCLLSKIPYLDLGTPVCKFRPKAVLTHEHILELNVVIHVKRRTSWLHTCERSYLCTLGFYTMGKAQAESASFLFHICIVRKLSTSPVPVGWITVIFPLPDRICSLTTTVSQRTQQSDPTCSCLLP